MTRGARRCDREDDVRMLVARTAADLASDPALEAHVAGCPACQDTLAIATWMRHLAAASISDAPLPDPAYLWWKAELLRRWHARQRAEAPLEVGERVQAGAGLSVAAALLVWLWRELPGAVSAPSMTLVTIAGAMCLVAAAAVMARAFRH